MENDITTSELAQAAQMLAAIGHPIRLQIFRELMQAGPQGLAAGDIARALGIAPSTLNFHLRALQSNQLISSSSQGRFVMYTAEFESMAGLLAFLTEDCCGGNPCMATVLPKRIRQCTNTNQNPIAKSNP